MGGIAWGEKTKQEGQTPPQVEETAGSWQERLQRHLTESSETRPSGRALCWATQGARRGLCLPTSKLPELEKVRGTLTFGRLSASQSTGLEVWKKLLLDETGFRDARGQKFQWLFHGGHRDWEPWQPNRTAGALSGAGWKNVYLSLFSGCFPEKSNCLIRVPFYDQFEDPYMHNVQKI